MREDNFSKLIFLRLNINSIRNKFESVADIIKDNMDILIISKSKVDDSFPDGQFFLDGFEIEMTFLKKLFLQVTGFLKVFI